MGIKSKPLPLTLSFGLDRAVYGFLATLRIELKISGIKHVVHENVVGGSSMIGFPLVIAVSEQDNAGFKP